MEEERKAEVQPSPGEALRTGSTGDTGTALSLEDQMDVLKAESEESSREKAQFREMLQRAQADLINYKRRTEEEREEQQKYANSRLINKLLPVVDDFNLAIDHAPRPRPDGAEASDAAASWLEGIRLIQRKLHSLLESESVTRIEVEGREFDPFEHEAMAYQESAEHQEGQVLAVVRDGYKLHGRVIRPALVILARKPETPQRENQGENIPSIGKEAEDA
jgi:molecular chaperone GrpE